MLTNPLSRFTWKATLFRDPLKGVCESSASQVCRRATSGSPSCPARIPFKAFLDKIHLPSCDKFTGPHRRQHQRRVLDYLIKIAVCHTIHYLFHTINHHSYKLNKPKQKEQAKGKHHPATINMDARKRLGNINHSCSDAACLAQETHTENRLDGQLSGDNTLGTVRCCTA